MRKPCVGILSAKPVNTSVGKLKITPQWAMRKFRFILDTRSPVSCRGWRRMSFARKSSRLCRSNENQG